ncbi:hypothetical protein QJS04_geneDACA013523 [Acorus gramineus]|uniref:DUF985 domain-containing protein n=1 Tax=Acorus gramineus TaxID=55184 RepID=A0AAV9AI00_ACOGR|nr:hypothetical protein QJS04_geneDACA013523 [Acorus gramineus]
MKRASEVAELLDLKAHPDGGYYSETFRDSSIILSKSLLPNRLTRNINISWENPECIESSINHVISFAYIHRIPCAESFHFYMGDPFTVFELRDDGKIVLTVLGTDLDAGHRPQYTVPPNVWFGLFPTRDVESYSFDGTSLIKAPRRDAEHHYSLVGVICAPAFQFEDNVLATRAELLALAPHAEPFIQYLTRPN